MPTTEQGFEFSGHEKEEWNSNLSTSMDSSIARAWARAKRQGVLIGNPVSEEREVPVPYTKNTMKRVQDFQYTQAHAIENHKNELVEFHSPHGHVHSESGLREDIEK